MLCSILHCKFYFILIGKSLNVLTVADLPTEEEVEGGEGGGHLPGAVDHAGPGPVLRLLPGVGPQTPRH